MAIKVEYAVQRLSEFPSTVTDSRDGWDDISYDAVHPTQVLAVKRIQQYKSRPVRIVKREVVETVVVQFGGDTL